MKKLWCHVFAVLIFCSTLTAQPARTKNLRNASYNIKVTLNAQKKQVSGTETITWKNITNKPATDIRLHLYMNAFKNNYSTFIKEAGEKSKLLSKKNRWGWIEIREITDSYNNNLTDKLTFIHPDDNNSEDRTVAVVKLARPVLPGRKIILNIDFTTQLPAIYARTGYYKNFFMIAQWFPKLGVFQKNGEWNCHQFHRNSEFFSDYGIYDVTVNVPAEFKVAGTGNIVSEVKKGLTKTVVFHAEDIHDFAWTASPDFLIKEINYRGTNIKLVYEKDHSSSVKRTFTAVKHAMDFFNSWAGPYPYKNLTILHPPTGAFRASGMEYPQFITAGTFWNIPANLRFPELVTVHEFGHQYWYGLVGNNEFEEAWLDEGINSYFESKIMDKYYGEESSIINLKFLKVGEIVNARNTYIGNTRRDKTLRPSWTYIGGGYSLFSYQKPVLMLKTLENIIGTDLMQKIFRTYFEQWKFRHPGTENFIEIVNKVTGKDYNWFFDQFLKNSLELDYKVASVISTKMPKPDGIFSDSTKIKLKKNSDLYYSVVKIHRKGEAVMPVDVLIVFDNSDSLRYKWDGKERWKKYTFIRDNKILYAEVDPQNKLLLDSNFTNNSRFTEKNRKATTFFSISLICFYQNLIQILSFIA